MKRVLVVGALVLGLSTLGSAQNGGGQGQNGGGQGQNGGGAVAMPEGPAFELPIFIVGGLGLWFWSRHRSARKYSAD